MDALPTNADALRTLFADLPASMQDFYNGMFEQMRIAPGDDYTTQLADRLHKKGENLLAMLVIERVWPDEDALIAEVGVHEDMVLTKLKVLHALHSYGRARHLAERAREQLAIISLQLTGNLASVIKSQALSQRDDKRRNSLLSHSLELYGLAFTEPLFEGSYWLGVNALAIATYLGQHDYVKQHIAVVRQDCLKGTGTGDSPDFWTLATVAELDLIDLLNNDVIEPDQINRMLASYERAEARCETTQQRKSARKNTGLLLDNLARTAPERASALQAAINQKLRPARIALFSGHRVDGPNRPTPRFPSERVSACHSALAEFIAAEKIDVGYSSAANGGDLIFIDELLKQGCGAHVVIPFAEEQFRNTTLATNSEGVDDSSDDDSTDDENQWVAHFDRLVRGEREGAVLWHASQSMVDAAGMDPYYAHTNRVILGMGRLKARELDGELVALSVMEPSDERSIGGTHAAVDEWRRQGIPTATWSPLQGTWRNDRVSLQESAETRPGEAKPEDAPGSSTATAVPQTASQALPDDSADHVVNRTLLFADVMGFSGFSDSQVAAFCDAVLGGVNDLVQSSDNPPLELNTWGDGLFMVFDTAVAGAHFALRLCELMKRGNRDGRWAAYDLPDALFMRVSLHSSPVRQLQNPLTQKSSHWGHNVSIAARIEPITPPNQVYGTASTAALIAAEGSDELAADFVGMVPLAKAFGTLELFRIHRAW